MNNEEQLADYDSIIRSQFVALKRASGSNTKYYKIPQGKHDKIFQEAAQRCINYRLDPVEYVNSVFWNQHPDRVFPPFLVAHNGIRRYNEFMNNHQVSEAELFDLYLEILRQQLYLNKTLEQALSNKGLPFPAWFRVLISAEAIPEIMGKYRNIAIAEMTPALRDFIKSKNLDYARITTTYE